MPDSVTEKKMRVVSKLMARNGLVRNAALVAVLAPVLLLGACAQEPPPPPAPGQAAPPAPPPAPAPVPRARG